ncbi:MAG: radical SAM protein [Chloroflexota bacterium]
MLRAVTESYSALPSGQPLEGQLSLSMGTAAVLGLRRITTDAAPTTAYLLLGGRCAMDCAFCAQARNSRARADALSRVLWPTYDLAEALSGLAHAYSQGQVQRCCIQVTTRRHAVEATMRLVRQVHQASPVPICAAVQPRNLEQVNELFAAGAERIGFGLDAACERVFVQVKHRAPGSWQHLWSLIESGAKGFPGKISVHLIAGLGETEQEMVRTVQALADWGVTIGLFAFTPVRGTAMENQPPPPLPSYRRLQAANFLIKSGLVRLERMDFSDEGKIVSYGLTEPQLRGALTGGQAFQTAGCPGCNRPYYNERPGRVMYNYPRPLTPQENQAAVSLVLEALAAPGGG